MEVYVNELPENCSKCEHCTKAHEGKFGIPFCDIARMPIYNGEDVKGRGHHTNSLSNFDCPLRLISEVKKQAINELILELLDKYNGTEEIYYKIAVECIEEVIKQEDKGDDDTENI